MMKKYFLHRGDVLVQTGHCPEDHLDAQVRDGLTLGIGDPPPGMSFAPPPPLSFSDSRRRAYPTLEDQLDAIWKGGQAMEDMRAKIQAVKDKFPKPVTP